MGAAFKLRSEKLVLSENDIERQITDFLRWHGWTPVRNHVGTFVPYRVAKGLWEALSLGSKCPSVKKDRLKKDLDRSTITLHGEGTADWLFVHSNYPAMWIEVKAPGKKPEPAQVRFLDERRILKQLATWTSDLEEFKRWYIENVIPKATD